MRRTVIALAIASFAMSTGALAQGPCQPNCGFIDRDVEVVGPDQTFMGMSNNPPPNENAAASQGTRTEHSVDTYSLNGPPGQVNNWSGPGDGCAQCSGTDAPTSSETVITDYPGANR